MVRDQNSGELYALVGDERDRASTADSPAEATIRCDLPQVLVWRGGTWRPMKALPSGASPADVVSQSQGRLRRVAA